MLLACLLLIGCAQQPNFHWERGGSSDRDFYQDSGYCKAQAFSVSSGLIMQIAIVYTGCMEGRGWQRVAN
jgi:hypothetical protein